MQSILFTNWTSEPFTHTWDKEEFTFQPGQSIYLQDYLANHFAKHLANRELIKKGKIGETDYTIYAGNENALVFKEFRDKALSQPLEAASAIKAEVDVMNLNEVSGPEAEEEFAETKEAPKKKGGRSKKVKPVDSEEEFAGLKE